MKRMITKAAAFVLICAMLTGCGSSSRKSKKDEDEDETEKTEQTTTETTEATTTEYIEHTEKPEPTTTTTSEQTTASTTESTTSSTAANATTLEEAMNQPEIKKQFDEQIDSLLSNSTYSSMYSKIAWKAEGNTLTYEYYYAQKYSKDQIKQIKSSIEGQKQTLINAIDQAKDGIELSLGVRPDEIAYVYYTKDGKEIVRIAG